MLKLGGRLLFHDIFQGDGGAPHYAWENKSQHSLEWFAATLDKIKQSGPPPLGIHLLMGTTGKAKFENVLRNLQEGSIVVVQAAAERG